MMAVARDSEWLGPYFPLWMAIASVYYLFGLVPLFSGRGSWDGEVVRGWIVRLGGLTMILPLLLIATGSAVALHPQSRVEHQWFHVLPWKELVLLSFPIAFMLTMLMFWYAARLQNR